MEVQQWQLRRLLGGVILCDSIDTFAADFEGGARVGEELGFGVA